MAFTHSLTYATEGAPLLIADLPSASAWRNSSGATNVALARVLSRTRLSS